MKWSLGLPIALASFGLGWPLRCKLCKVQITMKGALGDQGVPLMCVSETDENHDDDGAKTQDLLQTPPSKTLPANNTTRHIIN